MRIYITGAQSTGKTTLARWISEEYELTLITEVVRKLLAEREVNLDRLRVDVDMSCWMQQEIFRRQLDDEKTALADKGSFVSDRSLDFLAYTSAWATNAHTIATDEQFISYAASLRQSDALVLFVRPHRELVKADGFRAEADLKWREVLRIDAMIECLLETLGVPYIPVPMLAMRDRVRLVRVLIDRMKGAQ